MPDEKKPGDGANPADGGKQDFEKMYNESSTEGHKRYEQAKKTATMAVKSDPTNLLTVHEDDPELAEKISQKEYGISFKEAEKQIKGESTPSDKSGINEDELADKVYSKIEQKSEAKKVKEATDKFYDDNKIDGDFKKDFDALYEELADGKTLNAASTKKILDIAFREAKQTSKHLDEHEKAIADAKALGGAGKGDGGKTPKVVGRQVLKGKTKPNDWY